MTEMLAAIGSGVADIGATGNISFQRSISCRSGRIYEFSRKAFSSEVVTGSR